MSWKSHNVLHTWAPGGPAAPSSPALPWNLYKEHIQWNTLNQNAIQSFNKIFKCFVAMLFLR